MSVAPPGCAARGAVGGGEHVVLADAAGGAAAVHLAQVDAERGGDALRDRGDLRAVGNLDLGRLGGGARLGRGGGLCRLRAGRHAGDHLPDGDGLAGLGQDLRDRPGGGRRHLRVHLVGGDLDERLVGRDRVADLLRPLEHDALGDRLAHLRHDDVEDSPRPPSVGAAPLVGAISASTAPTWIVSPSAAWTLTTVPSIGAGTSASTLSVDISTSVSSAATESPSVLCHSSTVPSLTESPIAGMTTSTVVSIAIGTRVDLIACSAGVCGPATRIPRSRRTGRCRRSPRR